MNGYKNLVIGIAATLFSALVISAFYFRASTITTLSEHAIRLLHLEQRVDKLEHK